MQPYAFALRDNTHDLVGEDIRRIFKRKFIRAQVSSYYDLRSQFPLIFAESVSHFKENKLCTLPNCKPYRYEPSEEDEVSLPDPTSVSHWEMVSLQIQGMTALDLITYGYGDEDVNDIPLRDVENEMKITIEHTQDTPYRTILEDCMADGLDIVRLSHCRSTSPEY